jgi:hypothetical protein
MQLVALQHGFEPYTNKKTAKYPYHYFDNVQVRLALFTTLSCSQNTVTSSVVRMTLRLQLRVTNLTPRSANPARRESPPCTPLTWQSTPT